MYIYYILICLVEAIYILLPKKDLIQVEEGKLIIIMRISIYLLIITPTSHTYTL